MTPTAVAKVPKPPVRYRRSINFRGGATPIDVPGFESGPFCFINKDMQDHNGYGVECLSFDERDAYLNHRLYVDPSEPHPLVILDVEDDSDPWSPLIFERMEKQRAAIAADPLWKHVVCVPYLGHARELGKPGYSVYNALKHVDQLRDFLRKFQAIAPCLYFDPGDDLDTPTEQARMLRFWLKIVPRVDRFIYPVIWHYNKVARRICTTAEWRCQLDACTSPNVKGVIWWGDTDGQQEDSGSDSDPTQLAAFINQLKGNP